MTGKRKVRQPGSSNNKTSAQTQFNLLKKQLKSALTTLPPRHREVLEMRFGLEDGNALTRAEVALYFNCSVSTIRRMEVEALRRLRHPRILPKQPPRGRL
jgi:RNA polymerase primary sigma factor